MEMNESEGSSEFNDDIYNNYANRDEINLNNDENKKLGLNFGILQNAKKANLEYDKNSVKSGRSNLSNNNINKSNKSPSENNQTFLGFVEKNIKKDEKESRFKKDPSNNSKKIKIGKNDDSSDDLSFDKSFKPKLKKKKIELTDEEEEEKIIKLDPVKSSRSFKIVIKNIPIFFPYKPYTCQEKYMLSVIESLDKKQYGALESPTGTGKTLCLLCATIGWLAYQREQGCHFTTKIFYSSRTHTQLENVMKELDKTPYKINICLLASRKILCVNTAVNTAQGSIDTNCMLARKKKTCKYFTNYAKNQGEQEKMTKLIDIEDMKQTSKILGVCPFYQQRKLLPKADLIFLPYNYLLNNRIKTATKIELTDNIIIIDEAHNIDSVCEENKSIQITNKSTFDWHSELENFQKEVEKGNLMENEDKKNNLFGKNEQNKPNKETFSDIDIINLSTIIKSIHNLNSGFNNFFSNNKHLYEKQLSIIEFFEFIWKSSKPKGVQITIEDTLDSKSNKNDTDNNKIHNLLNRRYEEGDLGSIGSEESTFPEKKRIKGGFSPEDLDETISLLKRIDSYIAEVYQKGSTIGTLEEFLSVFKELYINHREYTAKKINEIDYAGNSFRFIITKEVLQNDYRKNQTNNIIIKLNVFCLNPGFGFKEVTNDNPHTILLTSGTLSPLDGLESELKCKFSIKLTSDHVIEKEQIKLNIVCRYPEEITNQGVLNFNKDNKDLPSTIESLGKMMKSLVRITPGGVLCFFTSFNHLNKCIEIWESNGVMADIRSNKEVFMDKQALSTEIVKSNVKMKLKNNDENDDSSSYLSSRNSVDEKYGIRSRNSYGVKSDIPEVLKYKESIQSGKNSIFFSVCRGSSSEGIDFSDKMARMVIIVGIPYPNLGDKKVILKKEYLKQMSSNELLFKSSGVRLLRDNEWYSQSALRAVNQAIGRVIRHINDYGVVCLLDQRYYSIDSFNFPKWTRQSIIKYNDRKLFADIMKFYNDMKTYINPLYKKNLDLQQKIKKEQMEKDKEREIKNLETINEEKYTNELNQNKINNQLKEKIKDNKFEDKEEKISNFRNIIKEKNIETNPDKLLNTNNLEVKKEKNVNLFNFDFDSEEDEDLLPKNNKKSRHKIEALMNIHNKELQNLYKTTKYNDTITKNQNIDDNSDINKSINEKNEYTKDFVVDNYDYIAKKKERMHLLQQFSKKNILNDIPPINKCNNMNIDNSVEYESEIQLNADKNIPNINNDNIKKPLVVEKNNFKFPTVKESNSQIKILNEGKLSNTNTNSNNNISLFNYYNVTPKNKDETQPQIVQNNYININISSLDATDISTINKSINDGTPVREKKHEIKLNTEELKRLILEKKDKLIDFIPNNVEKKRVNDCPICFESEVNFMSSKCGHVICEGCWDKCLKEKLECPMCKAKVRVKCLTKIFLNNNINS